MPYRNDIEKYPTSYRQHGEVSDIFLICFTIVNKIVSFHVVRFGSQFWCQEYIIFTISINCNSNKV